MCILERIGEQDSSYEGERDLNICKKSTKFNKNHFDLVVLFIILYNLYFKMLKHALFFFVNL